MELTQKKDVSPFFCGENYVIIDMIWYGWILRCKNKFSGLNFIKERNG